MKAEYSFTSFSYICAHLFVNISFESCIFSRYNASEHYIPLSLFPCFQHNGFLKQMVTAAGDQNQYLMTKTCSPSMTITKPYLVYKSENWVHKTCCITSNGHVSSAAGFAVTGRQLLRQGSLAYSIHPPKQGYYWLRRIAKAFVDLLTRIRGSH
jgi:hypothetical protein